METTRTSPTTILKALNILATWCQASGIKVLERNVTGLVVVDAGGMEQRVTLATAGETGPYTVDVKRLNHRKLSVCLAAFEELQVALGFAPKCPVNRGPLLERKLSNGEDSELAAFRHTEFRRAPNPSGEKFASYQWLVNQASKEFFTSFQWLCQDHMLDIDDLKTYANVWLVNFIGLHERAELTQTENDKLLHTYLNQRFMSDLRPILNNRGRNELPKLDDAHIALHGRPYDSRDATSWERAPVTEEEEDCGEDLDDDAKRAIAEGVAQRSATSGQVLSDLLAEMDHDEMVEKLTAVAENDRHHPDARGAAQKRLERHREECTACAATASPEVAGEGLEDCAE